jgi:hypothetical protein
MNDVKKIIRTSISVALIIVCSAIPAYAECREMLAEMRALAKELQGCQRSPAFKAYGFGQGGPYSGWLDRAKKLQSIHDKKGPSFFGDVGPGDVAYPEDIPDLGLSKVSCATGTQCDQEHIADIERRLANMRCR